MGSDGKNTSHDITEIWKMLREITGENDPPGSSDPGGGTYYNQGISKLFVWIDYHEEPSRFTNSSFQVAFDSVHETDTDINLRY